MNIKHKQAVRYLRDLEKAQWIIKHYNISGTMEYHISPTQYLMATNNEKYFRFNLTGKGRKGFDIFDALEKALKENSHPAEYDANQYCFTIPKRTRLWRKTREKSLKKDDRQKVTPIKENNPFHVCRHKNKTTFQQKFYRGWLDVCMKHGKKYKIPWQATRRLSEFQKLRSGLFADDRAVWHKGRVFVWNPGQSGYELATKAVTAKSDHLARYENNCKNLNWQKVTPVGQRDSHQPPG